MFLIGPEAFTSTGKILDDVVASTGGLVSKLKMASLVSLLLLVLLVVIAAVLAGAGSPAASLTRGGFDAGALLIHDSRKHRFCLPFRVVAAVLICRRRCRKIKTTHSCHDSDHKS